jgi:UPF0716 protein FxsA
VLLLLLLVIWPIAELISAVLVAEWIGILPMLLGLALGVPIGWWMIRAHGRGALRRLSAAIAERRTPTTEVLDGALGLFGGLLVMIPGFLSDVLGLLLVLPPTRAVARRLLIPRLRSSVIVRTVGFTTARKNYDVDSTGHDVQPPKLTA